jgi:transcriptional regulator with XRE-family HTH domain
VALIAASSGEEVVAAGVPERLPPALLGGRGATGRARRGRRDDAGARRRHDHGRGPRRGPAVGPSSPVAEEVRRRRKALRLTLHEAAKCTGVSYTVFSEVENGRRVPSPRTYQKLRAGLGLAAPPHVLLPPPPPAGLLDEHVTHVAACAILQRRGSSPTSSKRNRWLLPVVHRGPSALVGWRYDGSEEARPRLVRELSVVASGRPARTEELCAALLTKSVDPVTSAS